jgi:hypothetical protein
VNNPTIIEVQNLNVNELRASIRGDTQRLPMIQGTAFIFHTGQISHDLGYRAEWIDTLPIGAVESMAGTGNPFSLGELKPGENVVDCGSGAGPIV